MSKSYNRRRAKVTYPVLSHTEKYIVKTTIPINKPDGVYSFCEL